MAPLDGLDQYNVFDPVLLISLYRLLDSLVRGVACVRALPQHHKIQRTPQRVNVALLCVLFVLAYLRGRELRRSALGARLLLFRGVPEVYYLYRRVFEHDVFRFYISVDNLIFVQIANP